MKWWQFFVLLSSVFLSHALDKVVALGFGLAYLLVAIYAGVKDE